MGHTKYRALTPNENADLHDYQEALDYVFSEDKICNIALTGAYGSGKSSVIRSYEEKNQERTFIHISLAHFDEQGKAGQPDSDPTKIVNDLEGKILNQLIHQMPVKNIPQSYFQIKSELPWLHRLLIVLATLVFTSLWIYFFNFHKWVKLVAAQRVGWIKSLLLITIRPHFRLVGIVVIMLLFGIALFYFLSANNLQRVFKKVDLKGVIGFELFGAEEDTYFDKYLNKVLCLFDAADADAIVFEDLDRYDVTLIFEKLREINDLVYSRTKQGLRPGKKPLRFFYLIRDDVFTASDRSKFFDFIIPVVPYVDASNSCEQLLRRFSEVGLDNAFNKRFLQDVSLYLSDMRLLSNIVNEYIIYHGRLSGSGLKTQSDQQLAMVIYKNLYPGDFDLLYHGRGYVFALFESKNTLLEERRKQIDSKIDELNQQLVNSEREHLLSLDELNALFFPVTEEITVINETEIRGLNRTQLVKRILQNPDNVFYRYYRTEYQLDVAERRARMEQDPEYQQRKKALENRRVEQKLHKDIKVLEQKKLYLATLSIRELLDKADQDVVENFWNPVLPSYEEEGYLEKVQRSKDFALLKYLIRNGYIDETYAAYVSYFYPDSLTAQDRNFLLALSNRTPLDFDYHLDRPETIMERLDISDFLRRELRNFDLLRYLLCENCMTQIREWLQACDGDEGAYRFFIQFWHLKDYQAEFFHALYKMQPAWFQEWYWMGMLKGSDQQLFALDMLTFLSEEQLQEINTDHWLTDRISGDCDFLQIDQPNIPQLIAALKVLDVQFRSIAYRESDILLVQAVCRENLYVLNLPMLKLLMKIYWDIPDSDVESRSYSCIFHAPNVPLSQRVAENINEYAEVLLRESSARFSDDEDAVCDFLNSENLSEKYKLEYIHRMDTVLEDINSIDLISLWPALATDLRLKYTWQNIADYFAELDQDTGNLSPVLAAFIDSGTGELDWNYEALNKHIGKEKADKLRCAVLSDQKISLERFQTALAGMNLEYREGFPFTDVPDDRMKIILELNIVPMTVKNIGIIRKSYPGFWNDFVISTSPGALLKLISSGEITLTAEELSDLLEDSRLSAKQALELVNSFEGVISVQNRDYPIPIKVKIIQEHFDVGEIPAMLRSFDGEKPQIREAFLQYAVEHIEQIVNAVERIEYIPVHIYSGCLDNLTESEALKLRRHLANNDFDNVCTENKNPQFPNTAETRKILDFFKKYHWISSYKIEKGGIRAFSKQK